MQCIHFEPAADDAPGAEGEVLLVTDFFTVARRTAQGDNPVLLPQNRCAALMLLEGEEIEICHGGSKEPVTKAVGGDTILLPADLDEPNLLGRSGAVWLEITLPDA